MKYVNQLLIVSLFFSSLCIAQENDNRQLAIKLNNKAVDLIHLDPDSALTLLDSAIMVDSQYVMAYNNKVTIHCQKGEYQIAIETIKKKLLLDPKQAESVLLLGMLYEKTGCI